MINTNQSKLTPTLDRNTDRGGTITWEQLQSNNNCLKVLYQAYLQENRRKTQFFLLHNSQVQNVNKVAILASHVTKLQIIHKLKSCGQT